MSHKHELQICFKLDNHYVNFLLRRRSACGLWQQRNVNVICEIMNMWWRMWPGLQNQPTHLLLRLQELRYVFCKNQHLPELCQVLFCESPGMILTAFIYQPTGEVVLGISCCSQNGCCTRVAAYSWTLPIQTQ